jgi:hypothetical protein
MSYLLDDAVGAFLDTVTERAFDEPFLALLRAQGFTDLHLTHGHAEMGKDVIGRRDGEQWVWQSKAGDIGQPQWRDLRGQLDELRTVDLGHGAFDHVMPRRAVLVTTGRLTGNAPLLYQDYNNRAREAGEPILEVWDRDVLLGLLAGNPDSVLRGSIDGQLLGVLSAVEGGTATMDTIETFSRRWTVWELDRIASLGIIEAGLVCERLRAAERLDLACHLAACAVRGAWAAGSGGGYPKAVADAAGVLFETYALEIWERCTPELLDERLLVDRSGPSAWVTYPIRCARLAELLGLLALRLTSRGDATGKRIASWLVEFAGTQPGLAHPISDRYAVSLVPACVAIALADPRAAAMVLQSATVWLCDRYERGEMGLPSAEHTPAGELEHLLGGSFEWTRVERRRSSFLASILLDLCAVFELEALYADVRNDVEAVGINPAVIRLADGADQYLRTGSANRFDPNVDYAEAISPEISFSPAPHYADSSGRELCDAGRWWDLLAVSSALRDRHFVEAIRAARSSLADH